MNRQLIHRIPAGSLFLPPPLVTQTQVILKNWAIKDHSSEMQIMVSGDTLDITAPKGPALRHSKRLIGDYEISYRIKMLTQDGKHDRLSGLNCFWGANDPEHPKDPHAQATWRRGISQHYKSLKLFYVEYEGSHNSTTRFCQYYGGGPSSNDSIARLVIKECTDPACLLFLDQRYHIQIRMQEGIITYRVNREELLCLFIKCNEGDGYFGLRLLQNYVLFTDSRIKNL